MKKERLNEVLNIVLRELPDAYNAGRVVHKGKVWTGIGLCNLVYKLYLYGKYTPDESSYLLRLIQDNRPNKQLPYGYYWGFRKAGLKARIDFLNKLIKETE